VLRYRIPSSSVFMSVVVNMLQHGHEAFAHHLGGRSKNDKTAGTGPASRVPVSDYTGWERLSPLVRSFLTATLELLAQAQEVSLVTFVLRSLRPYIPYLQPFNKLIQRYMRRFTELFGSPALNGINIGMSSGEEEGAEAAVNDAESRVRIAAFMRLRQCAVVLPYPTIDHVLKHTYLAFVRNAKFVNESNAPSVLLMCNCLTELFGIDEVLTYQHAFVYIRQLALHLRAALTTKSKEALQAVYSWQFINCLRLWSAVLSRYATDPSKAMFQLVFPLTQIALGTARLIAIPRFFPLRVHVASMLIELSWSTGVFIPVLPLVLEMLNSPILTKKPKAAATDTPPALSMMIKVGTSTLESRAFQDALVNKLLDLVLDGVKCQYYSIALPELIVPAVTQLRTFAKSTRVGTWRHRAKALIDAFQAQAAKISAKRGSAGISPADRAAVVAFMSAEGEALKVERAKARELAAIATLKEAQERAAAAKHASGEGRRGERDEDDDDDEEDDEEESGEEEEGRPSKRARTNAGDEVEDEEDEESGPSKAKGAHTNGKQKPKHKKGRRAVEASGDVLEDIDFNDL
jgi:nucleolar complex protein 2